MPSKIGQAHDIWRYYNTRKSNVSEGARLIENYLYQKRTGISNKTKKDADLLTKFFKELKTISMQQKIQNPIQKNISANILGSYVKDLPLLDFTLGGNAAAMLTKEGDSGGIAFEKEIEKLILSDSKGQKITGTSAATAYINLGTRNEKSAVEFVKETLDQEIVSEVDNIEKNIVKVLDSTNIPHFYLKVGVARSGKVDIDAGTNAEINFSVEGQPTDDFKRAAELLKTSTFSIKSYLGEGSIHLGDTNPQKAVSAVAEYVASKRSLKNHIRAAAIYYIHHPIAGDDKNIRPEQEFRVNELYERYGRIKKVYELTGLGLKYDDIDEFKNVDFLLVNRASSNEINVYSTQDLVNKFGLNNYYKFDIK